MERAFYTTKLLSITGDVPADERSAFIEQFRKTEHNTAYVFGFSVFLGFLGIDRFLIGDWGRGLAKLLTAGGVGIWWFMDTALISGRAREKNLANAERIAKSFTPTPGSDVFIDTSEETTGLDDNPENTIERGDEVQASPASVSPTREKQVQFRSRPPKGLRSRPEGRVPV